MLKPSPEGEGFHPTLTEAIKKKTTHLRRMVVLKKGATRVAEV